MELMLRPVVRRIVRRSFWWQSVQIVAASVVLGGSLLPRVAKAIGITDDQAEDIISVQVLTVDHYNGGLANTVRCMRL